MNECAGTMGYLYENASNVWVRGGGGGGSFFLKKNFFIFFFFFFFDLFYNFIFLKSHEIKSATD